MKNSKSINVLFILLSILLISGIVSLSACTATTKTTTAPATTTAPTTPAAEVITLKFSDPMPPTNTHNVLRTWWKEQVEKRTNGRLKIEVFSSGALGSAPETLKLVKTGMVDMALIVPSYYPSDLPATQIVFLPFMAKGPDIQLATFRELYDTNKGLQNEWEVKNNVKIMSYSVPSDQVGGAIEEIKTLNDLKGKKLRALGSFLTIAEKVGSTPVNLSMTELYDAISKGTIDGFMSLPYDMVGPNKLNEVCKALFYWHCNAPGGSFDVINMDVWNKLPADIQKVLVDLRADTDAYAYENTVKNELKWTGILKDLPVNNFSDSDVEKIKSLVVPGIYNDWVARAEKAGVEAPQELLDQYTELIDKNTPKSTYKCPFAK